MAEAASTFLLSGESSFYIDFIITAIIVITCGIVATKIDNKILKAICVLVVLFMLARIGLKIFGISIPDVIEGIAQQWVANQTGVMPEYNY